MDTSNSIALLALGVSVLALPVSYFVARQQVKVGLDEHERRVRQRTRMLVADRLEELALLFFSTAKSVADLDLRSKEFDGGKLQHHVGQIDEAVIKTGILDRLGKAIDDYMESGDSGFQARNEIATILRSIRGQIHRGTVPPSFYATWDILNAPRANELPSLLRKN